MGQNISSQPKLSGEITLNRIRSTCQRDDKMPAELKNFNIKLLANDLNALGMDIPVVDGSGRARSSDDVCNDIKRATQPDVESVCMISNKGDAHRAIDNMVASFNKNYGARIQLYKDPLNKSKGKRNLAEVCDDLYLVLDKVQRRLTDQPKVIKQKLEDMISQLEERKNHIQNRMLPVIQNIQSARESDKTDEQINNANTLYNATNSLLNAQLRGAYQLTASTIKDITPESLGLSQEQIASGSGGLSGGLAGHLSSLKSNLGQYESNRWLGNRPVTDVTKNLLAASVASGLAINDCDKCMRKLGTSAGDLTKDDIVKHEILRKQLAHALARSNSDAETQELFKCYSNLAREAGCRDMGDSEAVFRGASAGVGRFDSSLFDINDQSVAQLIGQQLQGHKGAKMRSSPATTWGAASAKST